MRKNQKITAVVGGTAAAVLVGGVAFAYWSTSGSGTGSAGTSAGAASLVITDTTAPTNLYPGGAPMPISGTVQNTADNSAYVTQVVVSIASVTQAEDAIGSCDSSDYVLADTTMAVNQDLASGDSSDFSGATIQFVNKETNQDGCKGATVNLANAAS